MKGVQSDSELAHVVLLRAAYSAGWTRPVKT